MTTTKSNGGQKSLPATGPVKGIDETTNPANTIQYIPLPPMVTSDGADGQRATKVTPYGDPSAKVSGDGKGGGRTLHEDLSPVVSVRSYSKR